MKTFLITGCTRGLGLSLAKELILHNSTRVICTGRALNPPAELETAIAQHQGNISYVCLDVTKADSIQTAVQAVESIVGDAGLDILVNNAAIQVEKDESATQSFALQRLFDTNVIAVDNVAKAFLPLLKAGQSKTICNITSVLGSLTQSRHMALIQRTSYKVSKAALNMLTLQYAYELESQGFTVFALNPGHLRTDLGGDGAELSVEVGAKAVVEVLNDTGHGRNGRFRNIFVEDNESHDGKDVPW